MKKLLLISIFTIFASPLANAADAPSVPKKGEKNVQVEYAPSTLLSQTGFFDNKVKVTYPAAFKQIPLNIVETRYSDPSNRPKIVFAPGDNYNVNLALNLIPNDRGDRGSILRFFRDIKQSIRDKYPNDSEFMSNDVETSKQAAMIEVILPNSQNQKIYNLMYFAYIDSQFFYMNFSCPYEDMDKWQKTAWAIKDSVKLSK